MRSFLRSRLLKIRTAADPGSAICGGTSTLKAPAGPPWIRHCLMFGNFKQMAVTNSGYVSIELEL